MYVFLCVSHKIFGNLSTRNVNFFSEYGIQPQPVPGSDPPQSVPTTNYPPGGYSISQGNNPLLPPSSAMPSSVPSSAMPPSSAPSLAMPPLSAMPTSYPPSSSATVSSESRHEEAMATLQGSGDSRVTRETADVTKQDDIGKNFCSSMHHLQIRPL